ncbi:MAG: hypothetical protein EOP33_05740 [Rickettsiaceae bacterium]|nr:MAG: hypothetical protein EOP33_05740 [Rickettsiaceae bacterium]
MEAGANLKFYKVCLFFVFLKTRKQANLPVLNNPNKKKLTPYVCKKLRPACSTFLGITTNYGLRQLSQSRYRLCKWGFLFLFLLFFVKKQQKQEKKTPFAKAPIDK